MSTNNDCQKPDFAQKAIITLWTSLIFLVISSKFMYNLTSSWGLDTLQNGSPSIVGYLIHTVVFALLVFLSMYLTLPNI